MNFDTVRRAWVTVEVTHVEPIPASDWSSEKRLFTPTLVRIDFVRRGDKDVEILAIGVNGPRVTKRGAGVIMSRRFHAPWNIDGVIDTGFDWLDTIVRVQLADAEATIPRTL